MEEHNYNHDHMDGADDDDGSLVMNRARDTIILCSGSRSGQSSRL